MSPFNDLPEVNFKQLTDRGPLVDLVQHYFMYIGVFLHTPYQATRMIPFEVHTRPLFWQAIGAHVNC
jgi:hypothetical protein